MIDIISRASSTPGGVKQPSVLVHMSYSSKITSIQVTLMLVQAHPLLTLSPSHTHTQLSFITAQVHIPQGMQSW